MLGAVEWRGGRCIIEGTVFMPLPADVFERPHFDMEGVDFLVLKEKRLIERELRLISDLEPQRIFELGVFQGGSTAFMLELAQPEVLVAIDDGDGEWPELRAHIVRRGFEDRARLYPKVDQGDRRRLAQIADESFGTEPIDLIVDDCSHLYELTRRSFNELFPRLRPGGLYVIEDWSWAHAELHSDVPEAIWPDRVPLTRLVFELLLTLPALRDLIADVTIDVNTATVRRGDREIPSDFDISELSQPRGKSLLARHGGVQRGWRSRLTSRRR